MMVCGGGEIWLFEGERVREGARDEGYNTCV